MNADVLNRAVAAVRGSFPAARPLCGLVLGSGWADVAGVFERRGALHYAQIPGLGAARVAGHAGELLWASCANVETLVFCGRRHWYEGEGWEPTAVPVAVLKALDARILVLTNAAGGIRDDLSPGDLMLVTDHVNAMGHNPLIGPHDPAWGPRFPDQQGLYDAALAALARRAARDAGIPCQDGVYAAVPGPAYETPAEVRALRLMGADAVGMSTVPEAMLANAAGMRVLALSCITNRAATGGTRLSHDEVTSTARAAIPALKRLVAAVWAAIGREGPDR